MKKAIVMAVAAGLFAAMGVQANEAAAPAAKADPAKAQQIVNTICVGCHGADGNSPLAANPKLSGQHAGYITKQLQNFKSGERANPIMMGMAAGLSPEDMKNLGAYFNGQKPNGGEVKDKALAEKGEKLYRGGNLSHNIPACVGCHGQNANGIPAQYPRLAGQHADYIEAQLRTFRTGERANDPGKMMQGVAAKLSDADIKALAEYISGLK
ncbi:MAG: cytochrome c [Sulfuricella sp.]|nr:cytochrome c [Sulfuricella sp.]